MSCMDRALHSFPTRRSSDLVSRSVLDARFREVLGRSPIRYLTEWRMHHSVRDRKSTRLNSSHVSISYAVFCLKKKKTKSPTLLMHDTYPNSTQSSNTYSHTI